MWGASQADLRMAYISHIRSCLEYCAPVWFPRLSATQIESIEKVQRSAARLILGVKRCFSNLDVLLEANLQPLVHRLRHATAFQAERCRRLPPTNPLYILAHSALPRKRLRLRSSWQYLSDSILTSAGLYPAHLNVHQPCPPLFSLSRHPYRVNPHIAHGNVAK